MNDIVNWLKNHWFIFTALVAGGVAWGQTITQVAELEKKVAKNEAIAANQSRLDERTQMMQESMKEQNKMLTEILITQRAWAQKNNIVIENPAPLQTPRAVARPTPTQRP
jgi:hypothetical protein